MSTNTNTSNDVFTVTYRTNQHLYDTTQSTVVDRSLPNSKPTVLQWFLAIFIVHYFLWFIAMFAVVYGLYVTGYKYVYSDMPIAFVLTTNTTYCMLITDGLHCY